MQRVSGYSRVPAPPARRMPFMAAMVRGKSALAKTAAVCSGAAGFVSHPRRCAASMMCQCKPMGGSLMRNRTLVYAAPLAAVGLIAAMMMWKAEHVMGAAATPAGPSNGAPQAVDRIMSQIVVGRIDEAL